MLTLIQIANKWIYLQRFNKTSVIKNYKKYV